MNINLRKEVEEDYQRQINRYKPYKKKIESGLRYKRNFKNQFKNIQLAVLGKGQYFGEKELLDKIVLRVTSAKCITTKVVLYRMKKKIFFICVRDHKSLKILNKIHKIRSKLAEQKLSIVKLNFAKKHKLNQFSIPNVLKPLVERYIPHIQPKRHRRQVDD